MSIREKSEKIKSFWMTLRGSIYSEEKGLKIKDDLFIVILIIFVGLISFGLGKLSALEKTNDAIDTVSSKESQVTTILGSSNITTGTSSQIKPKTISPDSRGIVFASKSGTRYYYPDCSSRVKEENKVWFGSIEEAEAAGLSLASGCSK